MKKYNLTFWQWVELYLFIRPMWLAHDPKERKTWHDVKKGMEKHVHNYTIYYPHVYEGKTYIFWQCNHEGCRYVSPDRGIN